MAKSRNQIETVITANTRGFRKGAADVGRSVKRMQNEFTRFYRTLRTGALYSGVAILAREFGAAAKELVILGQKAKNVKAAFAALAQPGLMDNLRRSTGGMVSDFNLMQQSIKFINFGLDQSKLPSFLAFAQKRALQTGESIDHLVESIVVGLGRKSIKVIDNLSLDVSKFKDIVKETGDWSGALAKIIEDDMATGAAVATDEVLKLGTAWENLKLSLAPEDTSFQWITDATQAFADWNNEMKKGFAEDALRRIQEEAFNTKRRMGEISLSNEFRGNKESVLSHMQTNLEKLNAEADIFRQKLGKMLPEVEVFSGPSLTGFQVEKTDKELREEAKKKRDQERAAEKERMAAERAFKKMMQDQADLSLEISNNLNNARFGIKGGEFSRKGIGLGGTPHGSGITKGNDLQRGQRGTVIDDVAEGIDVLKLKFPELGAGMDKVAIDWASATEDMLNSITRLADGTKVTFKDVARTLIGVGGIIASIATGGSVTGIGGLLGLIFGKKATGGMASGMTLVGEAGPELVNFSQPARVHSAPATKRMLGGGDGGEVVFKISGDSLIGVLNKGNERKDYF